MAFHNTLTPILGDAATAYEPKYETSPEFMNGKFKECLDNDLDLLNKINVLNNDCFRLVDTGSNTSLLNWAISNPNKSAIYKGNGWNDAPPNKSGVWGDIWCIKGYSSTVYFKQNNENIIYFRIINDGAWVVDWQQIATTTKEKPTALLNGWAQTLAVTLCKNGDTVTVDGLINGGTITAQTNVYVIQNTTLRPSVQKKVYIDEYNSSGTYIGRKRISVSINGAITLDEAFSNSNYYVFSFSYNL